MSTISASEPPAIPVSEPLETKQESNPVSEPPPSIESDNEAAKFRRLHEKAERERAALEQKLKAIEDEKLSELDRTKRMLEEQSAQNRELLKKTIAMEAGLSAEAMRFLSGETEEEMRTNAADLAKLTVRQPVTAGTVTNPPSHQLPSMEERISQAEKAGHTTLAIQLKRELAFGPRT